MCGVPRRNYSDPSKDRVLSGERSPGQDEARWLLSTNERIVSSPFILIWNPSSPRQMIDCSQKITGLVYSSSEPFHDFPLGGKLDSVLLPPLVTLMNLRMFKFSQSPLHPLNAARSLSLSISGSQ